MYHGRRGNRLPLARKHDRVSMMALAVIAEAEENLLYIPGPLGVLRPKHSKAAQRFDLRWSA